MNIDDFGKLLSALHQGMYEREQVVALSLLTAVAGESLFLLGPPGVAKSMVARRLRKAFRNASSFEYLMSRFSTPDEVFGPVSISKLKNEDRYERLTDGYLPSANVVFLDEIWKAGPAIQNTLLTVLNEKVFRNGSQEIRIPMQALLAASNELPAEGEGLEALWDRFLVRALVTGICRDDLFDRMITETIETEVEVPEPLKLDENLLNNWRQSIQNVTVGETILSFIHHVRKALIEHNTQCINGRSGREIYVSDRRWKKVVNLMRTSAFLHGRSHVSYADACLLLNCLWNHPADKDVLAEMMKNALVTTLEEDVRVTLIHMRISSLRDVQLVRSTPRCVFNASYKKVQSFYYQLVTSYSKQRILIYISEFETLRADEPQPFILTSDKRNKGVQILRKYQKSKHPGIFPKDILYVRLAEDGVWVSDHHYPIVKEEGAQNEVLQQCGAQSIDNNDRVLLQSLEQEVCESRKKYNDLREQVLGQSANHFFLNTVEQTLLQHAFQNVAHTLGQVEHEIYELTHFYSRHE